VAIRPEVGERWGVWVIGQAEDPKPLSQGLTLEGAQVAAEDYVRQTGSTGLTWRGASWRQKSVTEYPKMARLLQHLHIPMGPGMTAGQASDLIGQAKLRRRLQKVGEVPHA
jgi:hypothetical protein